MLIEKITQKLPDIPEEKLPEIYDLIHDFRLRLNPENPQPPTPRLLKGKLGDTFFNSTRRGTSAMVNTT